MTTIKSICEKLKQKYLDKMTMFITLEPCAMCASAISEVHIGGPSWIKPQHRKE